MKDSLIKFATVRFGAMGKANAYNVGRLPFFFGICTRFAPSKPKGGALEVPQ